MSNFVKLADFITYKTEKKITNYKMSYTELLSRDTIKTLATPGIPSQ